MVTKTKPEGPASPAEGVERAELRAVLPGTHGLECVFYEYIAHRTARLRRRAYVTFVVEGGEFRPSALLGVSEHSPRRECQGYQMAGALLGGEQAYGKGTALTVSFVCYSPEGSGAADEAVGEIRDALEKLREVSTWPDGKRSWFGIRHGNAWVKVAAHGAPAYRPPGLPYRAGPPKPGEGISLATQVRGHLERLGMLEDFDRMMAERKTSAPPPDAPAETNPDPYGTLPMETPWEKEQRESKAKAERLERQIQRQEARLREHGTGYGAGMAWT